MQADARSVFTLIAILVGAIPAGAAEPPPATGWPVKVVIVTTFQDGGDTAPKSAIPDTKGPDGELRLWAERERLTTEIAFPGGVHPILANADHSVIAILTGMSLVNAGISVMALGLDPRFDLRQAYWLVAGIAGVDPDVASVGSAAWARFVLSDIAQSIDMREAPKNWPYGVYPNGADRPNSLRGADPDHGPNAGYPIVFPLNAGLAQWAWSITRNVKLPASDAMIRFSRRWSESPAAQRPPTVFLGDSLASDLYWHGTYLNQYARDWVALFTDGKGRFAMSDMEDSAIAAALVRLDRMKRADDERLMVLRTASNYTLPATGQSAFASNAEPYPENGKPAYEAAWRVGSTVVHRLVADWDEDRNHVPSAPAP